MVLKFHGGVRIPAEKLFAESLIKNIDYCSAVCIKAGEDAEISLPAGCDVRRGSLLGVSDGTPVYSSIAGKFNGILEIDGNMYYTVIGNGKDDAESPLAPETRPIKELTKEDIIESAKKFAIIDPRSGRPLWKLLSEVKNCRRIVVDCTEPFPQSAIVQQLCFENKKALAFGSKLLLHAFGALKCVYAFEHSKKFLAKELDEYAHDEGLFAMAPIEDKYPCDDRALMYALYLEILEKGETPLSKGVLIVSAEAVISLFEAMKSGMPQTCRYITLCGEGMEKGGNFRVPRGMIYHDLEKLCQGFPENKLLIENSLLSGRQAGGALADSTIAVIAADKAEKQEMPCISCGRCAQSCPARIFPAEILSGRSRRLTEKCLSCGACVYICPSGIPLMQLIKGEEESENE